VTTDVQLQEVASVVRGVTFGKGDASDEPRDGYIALLRAGNIRDELDIASDLLWVPEALVGEEQRMRPGDIAICMSSGSSSVVGKSARLCSPWTGAVGAFCALVRPNSALVLPEFLSFYLRSATFRAWTRQAAGASIKNIRKSDLERLRLSIPPLDEQRRIVDILSRAEGILRLRREAEKKAAELVPAIFLEMFGDPATNPKAWPTARIDELCAVQTGATPRREERSYFDGGTIPWIKTGEVDGGEILDSEEKITPRAVADTNCKIFPAGTILVAMYGQGQTRGRAGILRCPAATNQACAAILPGEGIAQEYLLQLLRIQYERLRALGRGGNQANLNLGMIKSFVIPVPPLGLQAEFSDRVVSTASVANQQASASRSAASVFTALLARTFEGSG
jgi:type I restriction enzyme S subunit